MTKRDRLFAPYREALLGLPVSHIWRGFGSAVFFEFGDLTPCTRLRRDGSQMEPSGRLNLGIEWTWRIEAQRSILCGSSGDERRWTSAFARVLGSCVVEATLVGRLPEIDVALSNGLHIASFSTAEGQPGWYLLDRREPNAESLSVERGVLIKGR